MFGQNTITPMPDYANYDLWDGYMGQLWLGLLECAKIKPDATIIEVAPGATAKIPHALSQLNFHGKLYIIEPHPEVSQVIYDKSLKLLPNAEIILLKEGFNTVRINAPIDAILANHPFDDFISAYANLEQTQDAQKLNVLFQDIANESEQALALMKQTWQHLSQNPTTLASVKQHVKTDWQNFVAAHNPCTVILSQYASSYFDKNDLSILNTHAKDLFQSIAHEAKNLKPNNELQKVLNQNENYQNTWIGQELLNADYWLLDERKYGK